MAHRIAAWVSTLAIVIILASCASLGHTKPNISIIDPEYNGQSGDSLVEARAILTSIAAQNHRLAQELGKLPELQNGIDQDDLEALTVIRDVYLLQNGR